MPSKITFWKQMRGLLSSLPASVGLMPTARLGTGTANATTFLRGDQSYASPVQGGSVTLDMMATVGMETVFYRRTVFDGPPEVRPLSELKTDLGLAGANTGDQTITLTGNVTGSGVGTFAATIANGAVTLAKQADMATASVVYRKTAGSGAPEVQTLATLKTDLGLTGTNSGDITINALTGTAYVIDVGTAGTDFNVTTAGSTITLNIPNASGSARGLVATGAQTIGGVKTFRAIVISSTTNVVCLDLTPDSSSTNHVQNWRDTAAAIKAWVDNAGILVLGNGQRINNAYTDDSNYDRAELKFVSDVFTIGSYAAGTGTLRDIMVGVTGNKLGFLGTTAIAKPTTAFAAATFAAATGVPVLEDSTFDGYTLKQVVAALRGLGLLT